MDRLGTTTSQGHAPRRALGWLTTAGWQLPAIVSILLILYGFSYQLPTTVTVIASALLLGAAAFVVGALIGFLFGVPRAAQDSSASNVERQRGEYRVNTNLEQISDWLTKILVGVGLIQLGAIGTSFGQLLDSLSDTFGGAASSKLVAGADLVFFSVWGFLIGYLLTRTSLTMAFRQFDVTEVASLAAEEAITVVQVKAEERELERDLVDARALVLTSRILSPSSTDDPIKISDLTEALRAATAPIREQVLLQAQTQRRDAWEWREEPREEVRAEMMARHARTIPLLRSLAEAHPEDPRIRAELGYALKDDSSPNLPDAYSNLSAAVSLAEIDGSSPDWYLLNRGIVGIRLRREGSALPATGIINDLTRAAAGRTRVRAIVETDPEIQDWARLEGVPIP